MFACGYWLWSNAASLIWMRPFVNMNDPSKVSRLTLKVLVSQWATKYGDILENWDNTPILAFIGIVILENTTREERKTHDRITWLSVRWQFLSMQCYPRGGSYLFAWLNLGGECFRLSSSYTHNHFESMHNYLETTPLKANFKQNESHCRNAPICFASTCFDFMHQLKRLHIIRHTE